MNDNAGSPNVVPEAVARAEAIVEMMRDKFLDWLRTNEATLKGHLATLETDRTQMGSEVQADAVDAVRGLSHEMHGFGGTLETISTSGHRRCLPNSVSL